MKTPLSLVKERFGDKEKLVAAVEKLAAGDLWIARVGDKELSRVSNTKLLRLHDALTQAAKDFGSRAKLVSAILALEGRDKDAGLKLRLEGYALPRLLDTHRSAKRRAAARELKAKALGSQTPAPTKKKKARSKLAQAIVAGKAKAKGSAGTGSTSKNK